MVGFDERINSPDSEGAGIVNTGVYLQFSTVMGLSMSLRPQTRVGHPAPAHGTRHGGHRKPEAERKQHTLSKARSLVKSVKAVFV